MEKEKTKKRRNKIDIEVTDVALVISIINLLFLIFVEFIVKG